MGEQIYNSGRFLKGALHSEWRLVLVASSMAFVSGLVCANYIDAKLYMLESIIVGGLITAILLHFVFSKKYTLNKAIWVFPIVSFWLSLFSISHLASGGEVSYGVAYIDGEIKEIEFRDKGVNRILILVNKVDNQPLRASVLAQVSVRTRMDERLRPGSLVHFRAMLEPLNGPLVPGGYDFSRRAYFRGIAYAGYSLSDINNAKLSIKNNSISNNINLIRKEVEVAIMQALPGQAGAVASAMLVGYRGHISPETSENLKRAGFSHLLAISGLHMGLVAGGLFFVFEALFAAIPSVALRIMPRKLAAGPAWVGTFIYLLLSGMPVSATRAFIMVSVAFLAVLMERRVLSLRSVALAAIAILLIRPYSALEIGFQMSFAATAGLVAFYEAWTRYKQAQPSAGYLARGHLRKVIDYFGAIMFTSVVAQVSVALFALYHFQTLSLVAFVSNSLAVPLVGLFIMPLLMVSLVLPAGFTASSSLLRPALDGLLAMANWFSSFENSVFYSAPMAGWAFLVCTLLFVSILLCKKLKLAFGLAVALVTVIFLGQTKPADILISETGKLIASRNGGQLQAYGLREGSFRDRVWRSYWGISPYRRIEKLLRRCDVTACRYDTEIPITYAEALPAVRAACAAGDIVILPRRYKRYCKGAITTLTFEEVAEKGPAAIHLANPGVIRWSSP